MSRRALANGFAILALAAAAASCSLFGPGPAYVSVLGGKARKMQIRLEGAEQGICPGRAYQLAIRVLTADGKDAVTWKKPESGGPPDKTGFLDFSEFAFRLRGGTLDEWGVFHADPDALPALAERYAVAAAVKDRTSVNASAEYDLKLGCDSVAALSGARGGDGPAGDPGAEPGAGQETAGAADGRPGTDGGYGGNGVPAEVASTIVRTPSHAAVVLVRVTPAGGPPRHFALDPASRDGFTVDCRGGDGGNGGNGGPGATGGHGGRGGDGGDGGDGGPIRGGFDANQPLLQSFVKYRSAGGQGGAPGQGGPPGGRDSEGRPMLPGEPGRPGQPGRDGPKPDIRPVPGAELFPALPAGVTVLAEPWIPSPPPG